MDTPKLPHLGSFNSQRKENGTCLKNFREYMNLALGAADCTEEFGLS